MNSIFEKYSVHNQECFCKLDSGLYRVYWYDSEMRGFYSNGALVHNITHWLPVEDIIDIMKEESGESSNSRE